jgi:hypothetical protein
LGCFVRVREGGGGGIGGSGGDDAAGIASLHRMFLGKPQPGKTIGFGLSCCALPALILHGDAKLATADAAPSLRLRAE